MYEVKLFDEYRFKTFIPTVAKMQLILTSERNEFQYKNAWTLQALQSRKQLSAC